MGEWVWVSGGMGKLQLNVLVRVLFLVQNG